jgi:hypothetical protein
VCGLRRQTLTVKVSLISKSRARRNTAFCREPIKRKNIFGAKKIEKLRTKKISKNYSARRRIGGLQGLGYLGRDLPHIKKLQQSLGADIPRSNRRTVHDGTAQRARVEQHPLTMSLAQLSELSQRQSREAVRSNEGFDGAQAHGTLGGYPFRAIISTRFRSCSF